MNKGNFQKTPLGNSLPRIALEVVGGAIQQLGQAIPCEVVAVNGGIVTVKFEANTPLTLPQIMIPVLGSQWLRQPIQVGDQGMTVPCDFYLGGISGLGGGVATLTRPHNLTALAFAHVGQTGWPASPNPNAAWINGPDGVVLSDTAKTTFVTLTPGQVQIQAGGKTWTFNASGLTMSDGIVVESHVHQYTPGTGTPTDTGPPLA